MRKTEKRKPLRRPVVTRFGPVSKLTQRREPEGTGEKACIGYDNC